ncbi:MAG: uncharacterized membrane protein YjjP (DUF1212 family) [Paraglaciecola sp.]|jgi:uncharacterized membrane protein YjjP (DUF1212 family)
MFKKLFYDHPASLQETYVQHFFHAMGFSIKLFKAALACFIHALVPGLCIKTGSRAITKLHHSMVLFRVEATEKESANNDADSAPEYMI